MLQSNCAVELIYSADCPNTGAVRAQLLRAFAAARLAPRWTEWQRDANDSPDYVRQYGSPTLLVDGRDLTSDAPSTTAGHCRVYRDPHGRLRAVPPLADIVRALENGASCNASKSKWTNLTAAAPAVAGAGLALLPKLTCPACWPAYAGLFSALGLGFIDYTPYLLPLTVLFLAVTLATLTIGAARRRGYRPLLLGTTAGFVLVAGKFLFDSDAALYSGIVLLVGASLWNTWPVRDKCSACLPSTKESP